MVERLKSGLDQMKTKLSELKAKRDELVARAKSAEAQNRMMDSVKSIDVLDPTSELSRFEDKVRREEARALGKQELAASSWTPSSSSWTAWATAPRSPPGWPR